MLDIKELTLEQHKNAERQEFVKILMSGEINPELYATYLYNQLQCYAELEKWGMHNGLVSTDTWFTKSRKHLQRLFKVVD
jgi:heme oxygenase